MPELPRYRYGPPAGIENIFGSRAKQLFLQDVAHRVLNEQKNWIREDEGSGFEVNAVLLPIGLMVLRGPLQAHTVKPIVRTSLLRRSAVVR